MEECLPIAWKFVNDSYMTDVHLLHKPHIIALAAIYMAALTNKDSDKDINKWFSELNVNLNEVGQVATEILSVYEMWTPNFEQQSRDFLLQIQTHHKHKKK